MKKRMMMVGIAGLCFLGACGDTETKSTEDKNPDEQVDKEVKKVPVKEISQHTMKAEDITRFQQEIPEKQLLNIMARFIVTTINYDQQLGNTVALVNDTMTQENVDRAKKTLHDQVIPIQKENQETMQNAYYLLSIANFKDVPGVTGLKTANDAYTKVTEQYVAAIQGLTVANAASTYAQLGRLHKTYLEASQAITPQAFEIASQAKMDEPRFQDALATMYQTLLEQAGEISVQE
ncbi:hypothetical protein [Listeria booriae]|uniref:hypothetical protein n=1 Tax=Listeria booriae TaxID=1552123 RepID=UPI00162AA759|nr:hypothetical protein [Listeria booriae]MBC2676305.1 hypothetical protein [Listeria booriae]